MVLPLEASTSWPSGFVTFVLTDIEGSTRMLRRLGPDYDEVIGRHNTLLRETWERHGGAHVSDRGDSCLAAFSSASSALVACADAQRRLATAPWPKEGRPLVRMGVHSGVASPRGDDYIALAVHQAARVASAAHGGQVLASDVVADDTDPLPDLDLAPVGKFRLRDFDAPVTLHCLRGVGLESNFPAVRATPVDGHNLTTPPTSLIGRDGEVAEVTSRLAAGRLITLTGPGGVGKTRLALAIGLTAAPNWEDGVWFVDLSPLQDAGLIGPTVASALGVAIDRRDAREATIEHLDLKRALIVIDNCEHVADRTADFVAELLATASGVGVIATSREPLGIAREQVFRVDPLPLPTAVTTVDAAVAVPSVQLFVERARLANARFTLTDHNVAPVVELCRRLDGLPLALELAAAQTAVLGIHDLVAGLDDRGSTMRNRQRDIPDRQRTMEAAVDWSLRLLTPQERSVLRRLTVLRAGFSLDAAVAAAGGDIEADDVRDVVWSLVEKSLVTVDLSANETRYRLLETVRARLRFLLDEAGETLATALRLADWWLTRVGPWHHADRETSGEIEVELDNLRALVPLIAVHDENRAQQLVCSIGRHYYAALASSDRIVELSRYVAELSTPSPTRVSMLGTLALMQVHRGDVDAARATLALGEHEQEEVGAPSWDEVAVERASGEIALRTGDYAFAASLAERNLERALGAPARARMLNLLAIASYFAGDEQRATEAFAEELEMARQIGDEHLIVIAEGNVAEQAMRRGDAVAAARHQAACLELALALGRPVSVALSFIVAARLVADTDPLGAAELHAKAEVVLEDGNFQLYDDDLAISQAMLDDVQRRLGDTDYRSATDRGRSLTLLDATTVAREALARVAS
jgi:predicted ATPase/class 3 adenylate cyclase